VTLPLKRAYMRRDLDPQIHLRMRNVRSHQRLARMTGREALSTEELLAHVGYRGAKLGSDNSPNVAPTGKISGVDTTQLAADVAGEGFSQVDIEALLNNTLTPANLPSTANSLGLDIATNDVAYIATVQMGTPPRDFNVLMDSGSADLWVGAEKCVSEDGSDCGNHTFLGTESSSSAVLIGKPFNVTYGSGSVIGDIIQDDLVVAGMQLPGHTFGVATVESPDFASSNTLFDGIMGLAQSTLSQQQTLTPVESLAQAGLIKEAIVSYKLSRLADQKNDGEVTFGGLDTSKFDQSTLVTLNNLNKAGFWEAGMDAVSVNGKDLGLTNRTAIMDTGTTLLLVPQADADAIHRVIPGAQRSRQTPGTYTLPCTTQASLALTFGGRSFAIDSRDITFTPLDLNNPTGDCVSGITAGQIGSQNEWLVGDVFLKNAYFSTDVGANTVQLAKLV